MLKRGIFWEAGVDSGIQSHLSNHEKGSRSWGGGGGGGWILGTPRIYPGESSRIYPGVDSGRFQNLPGYSFKGGIIWGVTPVHTPRYDYPYYPHFGKSISENYQK